MASVESLSDSELRRKLAEYGYPVGPVTETSRKVLMNKLKQLMVQAGRSSDVTGASKWRRSSSRFSSGEEESENDDSQMRLNSTMPPPSSNFRNQKRRSTGRLSDYPLTTGRASRRKDTNFRNDLFSPPKTAASENELSKKKHQRVLSSPGSNAGSLSNSSVCRVLSRATVSSSANDGFETGSDSDIDSKKWDRNTGQVSPPSVSPVSVSYSSFLSRLSSVRPRHKSDNSGGDNSANTRLGFRKSSEVTSRFTNTVDVRGPSGTTYPPFQSNFVKRLSGSSSNTFGTRGGCCRRVWH
jgi:membrane protein Man1